MNEDEHFWQIETPETLRAFGIILRGLSTSEFVLEEKNRKLHINVVGDSLLKVDFFADGNQSNAQGKIELKTFSQRTPETIVVFSAENGKLVIKSAALKKE